MPNEHICASALYYYDSSNVTDSYLAFRESVNENFLSRNEDSDYDFPAGPSYDQNRYDGLLEIYGIDAEAEDIVRAAEDRGPGYTMSHTDNEFTDGSGPSTGKSIDA